MKHKVLIIDSDGKAGNFLNNKNNVINQYLSTSAGRQQLAAAMANPIHRNLNYAGIARKIFQVQQLPQGALPYYNKDIDIACVIKKGFTHKHLYITSRGKVRKTRDRFNAQRVTIPTFEIFSNPIIRIADVKRRRFHLIDRGQRGLRIDSNGKASYDRGMRNILNQVVQKARQQIMQQEDEEIFKALNAAGKDE